MKVKLPSRLAHVEEQAVRTGSQGAGPMTSLRNRSGSKVAPASVLDPSPKSEPMPVPQAYSVFPRAPRHGMTDVMVCVQEVAPGARDQREPVVPVGGPPTNNVPSSRRAKPPIVSSSTTAVSTEAPPSVEIPRESRDVLESVMRR
jgi:hypothetical protein